MCGPAHKGHADLTSSPPSSSISLVVLRECGTHLFLSFGAVLAGRTKPTTYHTTGQLNAESFSAVNSTSSSPARVGPKLDFTKQARNFYLRASCNQTKALTRNRKAPATLLLTAQLRAGTQLVALARHSAPRLTSVAKTFSLGACLSNTKRGFRSLKDLTKHLTTRADDSHATPV